MRFEGYTADVLSAIEDVVPVISGVSDKSLGEIRSILLNEDSVTGNASGSFTFDRGVAKELTEQLIVDPDFLELIPGSVLKDYLASENYEGIDVYARCKAVELVSDEDLQRIVDKSR